MGFRAVSEAEWEEISWLVPVQGRGRPRSHDREIFNTILYVLFTNCRWRDLPPVSPDGEPFAPKSTAHNRFQRWTEAGFFDKVLRHLKRLLDLNDSEVFHLDATFRQAKKGGSKLVLVPAGKKALKSI